MPFVKGQSGNPQGARLRKPNRAEILARAEAERAIKALVENLTDENGAVRNAAAVELLKRGFGQPREFIEITGEDGGPIETVQRLLPETDAWIAGLIGRNREEETSTPPLPH